MARPVTLFTGQWADLSLADLLPKVKEMGYDGVELACWGDHFDVQAALNEDGYVEYPNVEVIREMAGRWIDRAQARGYSTQAELRVLGHAYLVREQYAEAESALERSLAAGGPFDEVVRSELVAVRGAARRAGSAGGDGHRTSTP